MPPMSQEVEVDADLAARTAELAAARGETIDDVIRRALIEYVTTVDNPKG